MILKDRERALLSDEEAEILLKGLATSRGDKGFSDKEAAKLIRWAEDARLSYTLVELALDGLALIGWDAESDEPVFKRTEAGNIELMKGYRNGLN